MYLIQGPSSNLPRFWGSYKQRLQRVLERKKGGNFKWGRASTAALNKPWILVSCSRSDREICIQPIEHSFQLLNWTVSLTLRFVTPGELWKSTSGYTGDCRCLGAVCPCDSFVRAAKEINEFLSLCIFANRRSRKMCWCWCSVFATVRKWR